jgi:hypothetical protein
LIINIMIKCRRGFEEMEDKEDLKVEEIYN